MSLNNYIGGYTLVVTSHSEGLVFSYDGKWTSYPLSEARGVAGLNIANSSEVVTFNPDGTHKSTVSTPLTKAHEIVETDQLYLTAPQTSNIITLDGTEVWRVPGIHASSDHRSHVNGIGTRDGVIRYVTTLGIANKPIDLTLPVTPGSWQEEAVNQRGALIDITTNQILFHDLDFPHSPRWQHSKLWFLNSNPSQLVSWDGTTRTVEAQLSGFLRGLLFLGNYAFITCSWGRNGLTNPYTPDVSVQMPRVGVSVVDISSGQEVWFEPLPARELFDVQLSNTVIG